MTHRKTVGMALLLMMVTVSMAWAADAPLATTPEPMAVSFGVGFDVVLDNIVEATRAGGSYGCAAPFSCSESCYAQRISCMNNCNGNIDCIADCIYCYRVCAFTC